jgi:probable phosphoglycerate mutase
VTQLLFIRHGETDWNRRQCFQGQLDVPLNATGHAQAARLAARLADDKPDAFYCSDLLRACQTAQPLARAWGMEPVAMPGFREQAFGVFEGLDFSTIQARHAELWPRWVEQSADFALPGGGESMAAFSRRVLTALADIVKDHPGQRVAVVTHGGVLDALWRSAHRLPLHGGRACEIPNTGINRLAWTSSGLAIEAWGDATHLEGLVAAD